MEAKEVQPSSHVADRNVGGGESKHIKATHERDKEGSVSHLYGITLLPHLSTSVHRAFQSLLFH